MNEKEYRKKYYSLKNSYYTHYYKNPNLPNPYKTNFKQSIFLISKEKICIVCGNTFFTKGRVNSGKTCSVDCRKKHYQRYYKTPERKAKVKSYQLSHLKERQIYLKNQERINPNFKLAHLLRSNLRTNLALKFNDKKDSSFASLTGYSYADARKHLEKQFEPYMNWGNYGKVWEVDHVVPLKWFKTKEQFLKRGWALKNLQPLETSLNLAKQDKFIGNPKTKYKVIYL